jgi:cell division protein FtsQ
VAARRRTTARAAVLPARRGVSEIGRIAPSGRSLLVGIALLLAAFGGYLAARDTSVFAVQAIDVRGGTPQIRASARAALRDEIGVSLLRVDGSTIERRLTDLSSVRGFRYDRAFPHTLRVTIRPERPVLVLRQSDRAYLVAASGRVLRALPHPRLSGLPRLYVTRDVEVTAGARLPASVAGAAAVLAPLEGAPLPGGVHLVEAGKRGVTLVLGRGLQLRLGDTGDLRLKLAIARRILRTTAAAGSGGGYLDVSVPERPVLAANAQVGG